MAARTRVKVVYDGMPAYREHVVFSAKETLLWAAQAMEESAKQRLTIGHGISDIDDPGYKHMVDSIQGRVVSQRTAEVSAESESAIYNEYGTVNRAAIPSIRPAFDEIQPIFLLRLRASMKHVI